MENKNIALENTVAVGHLKYDTMPSDELFAEQGKPIELSGLPWNLVEWTGSEEKSTVLIRATVNLPQDGWYTLCAGADWWLCLWIDGLLQMNVEGDCMPDMNDHRKYIELKAGKHTIDIRFSRGQASAMAIAVIKWHGTNIPQLAADLETAEASINKALHGSNTTLLLSSRRLTKYDDELRKLNFTLARTHDWPLWNAGQRIIDTHFIFPLLHLNPKEPANYYFKATDEIIRLTQEEGKMEVFYRLGTSIEHTGSPHFNIIPPEDYEAYAEVLAGIVRHYTRGWADGFHYNIRYWEIWNEPNLKVAMWDAPFETFIPLFVTVLKRLKSEFPELQFGGPALCCFSQQHFTALLEACRKEGIAPDFISWHCYGQQPEMLVNQPNKGRALLDSLGFTNTKLCINEWHYVESWSGVQSFSTPEEYIAAHEKLQGINSGVYNLAVLSGWQYGPLDLAMWYGAGWDSPSWGYRDMYKQYTKNYYSMEMFGIFIKEYAVRCHSDSLQNIYLLAGTSADGKKAGILVADFKGEGTELKIRVSGIEKYTSFSAIVLDKGRNNESVPVIVNNGCLQLKKAAPGSAAFLIQMS